MSNEFDIIQDKKEKEKFSSKIRVINSKYNSLGVTIPKQIVETIGLKKDDLMIFTMEKKSDKKVIINIELSMNK